MSNYEYLDFNPRSHERSDRGRRPCFGLRGFISIHAPTRGATTPTMPMYNAFVISIHAPTRGATNPLIYKALRAIISIHAPTRGATRKGQKVTINHAHFNPRSHERSDSPYA